MDNNLYKAVQLYKAADLKILTLHAIMPDGSCECGHPDCTMAGKHPANASWQNTMYSPGAYRNIESAKEYDMHVTGFGWLLEDNHLVVDVDPKNGGFESFDKLCKAVPELKECGIVANTGGGGFHCYYNVPVDYKNRTTMPEYPGIDFKAKGGFVVAAGSLHASGKVYDLDKGYVSDDLTELDQAPQALLDIIEKKISESTFDGEFSGNLADVVAHIPNNDMEYDEFVMIGMGIHSEDPNAFELWDIWAQKSDKYDAGQMSYKWSSFGKSSNGVTIGTLIKIAQANGYKLPASEDGGCVVIIPDDHVPYDPLCTKDFDLLSPPGIVGDIVKHINNTAFRDRPNIAVGAALWATSSAMNKAYSTPTHDKVSLYVMAIAGSGSGKDNPYSVAKKMLTASGLGRVVYPKMASGQEVRRVIMSNQMGFYSIDEAHGVLGAIGNSNAADYMQTIETELLTLYTDSSMSIRDTDAGGFVEKVHKDIAAIAKQLEDVDSGPLEMILKSKMKRLEKRLTYIDKGVPDPFISLYATSTAAKLDSIVNHDTLTSGLMARTLLFKEYLDTPDKKSYGIKAIKKVETPLELQKRFNNIVTKGRAQDTTYTWSDNDGTTISWENSEFKDADGNERSLRKEFSLDNWGEPIQINITDDAVVLSERMDRYFDRQFKTCSPLMVSIWARAMQMTTRIASVLSVESGVIGVEELFYAFALTKEDANVKTGMSWLAEGTIEVATEGDRSRALATSLVNLCKDPGGRDITSLFNSVKHKYDMSSVEIQLELLVTRGIVEKRISVFMDNTQTKWFTLHSNFAASLKHA